MEHINRYIFWQEILVSISTSPSRGLMTPFFDWRYYLFLVWVCRLAKDWQAIKGRWIYCSIALRDVGCMSCYWTMTLGQASYLEGHDSENVQCNFLNSWREKSASNLFDSCIWKLNRSLKSAALWTTFMLQLVACIPIHGIFKIRDNNDCIILRSIISLTICIILQFNNWT